MLVLPTPPFPLVTAMTRRRGRDGGGANAGLPFRWIRERLGVRPRLRPLAEVDFAFPSMSLIWSSSVPSR